MQNDNEIKDRLLGDEWQGWSGELIESEKQINESPWLFIVFYFFAIVILNITLFLIFYLISPRLKSINYLIEKVGLFILIFIFAFLYIRFFLLVLTLLLKKNFLISKNQRFGFFLTIIYKLAEIFKISKDKIGNSFIKLNNILIYSKKIKKPIKNLLILLPRCLNKDTREKVMEIIKKYNCKVFIATGGSSARQVVKKEKPDAIIGVACERDLVSGMKDSSKKISIIAIENKRPEGPCKNTIIDIQNLENAIKYFLNIK